MFDFVSIKVGGFFGISYDKNFGIYYFIFDDESENNVVCFYIVDIDLSDGSFDDGDVEFISLIILLNRDRVLFL